MGKVIGDIASVPNPKSDWLQNDSRKADYIKNKPDIYTKTETNRLLNQKANKDDLVCAYKFIGSVSTFDDLPFAYPLIPNGVPTHNGVACGTYDEETHTVTINDVFLEHVHDDRIIVPIVPISIKAGKYFTEYVYYGNAYIGNLCTYVCGAGNSSYEDMPEQTIDHIEIFTPYGEETISGTTNSIGTLDKIVDSWLIYEWSNYPEIPNGAYDNGAVYNVLEDGMNYAWNGTSYDALGGEHRDIEARTEIDALEKRVSTIEEESGNKPDLSAYANALKGNASGEVIGITDISPIEHNLGVKLSSDTITDFSTTTLNVLGKNLINADKFVRGNIFVKNADGSYTFTKVDGSNRSTNYAKFNFNIPTGSTLSISVDEIEGDAGEIVIQGHCKDDSYPSFGTLSQTKKVQKIKLTNELVEIRFYFNQSVTNGVYFNIKGIQLEIGESATEFEEYIEPTSYIPNADGTVEGVKSIYPNTTLTTDTSGVLVECEYNKDTNKVIENLVNAIISLGGNV